MEIILCAKRVLDPRLPPASFRSYIQDDHLQVPANAPYVLSTFDEYALELALRLKDAGDAHITVMTLGPETARDVLRHTLAMGADEAVLIDDTAFGELDSFGTARVLSKAIQKLGSHDLVLCGRQAADWDAGQVGPLIALDLGLPAITVARRIDALNGAVRVERTLADGYEVLEVPTPAVITVGDEGGVPRLRTGLGTVRAARASISSWTSEEIGLDAAQLEGPRTKLRRLFIPAPTAASCELMEGESPEEMGEKLAETLRANNII